MLFFLYMQPDCGRLRMPPKEKLSPSRNFTHDALSEDLDLGFSPFLNSFLCLMWVKREAVSFVVQFGTMCLGVQADAKNEDVCPYNLVYLRKNEPHSCSGPF
ncbi:hypothetical protein ATANTOWER_030757 [Ataeniobius toweri]|uniref:Uncharacterized protein n=1 Tax=Ataeniobius toweri TaxID=208326 RepID=A0ABU7BVY8_9TELE|nr:hypothetical protein [Ataeniobius toweri]